MRSPDQFPGLLRYGLVPFSWPYGLAVRLRNLAFDRGWRTIHRVGVPVISIGNLSVGGTGKTPCVEYVGRWLSERGDRPCLLSRGYRAGEQGVNDEALVLEENLPDVPHLQNPDRVAAARIAIDELEADVLVLDDGFQHRRLHRDLDVVLIDATRPPHRDRLLPAGTLREPWRPGLRRADAIILTRCDRVQPGELEKLESRIRPFLKPGVPVGRTIHEPRALVGVDVPPADVATLRGQPVAMVCGLGHPAAFRGTLESLGAKVVAERVFPDHHRYTRDDVTRLREWAAMLPAEAVIAVTQKDHVKLQVAELGGRRVRVVTIGLTFQRGEAEFLAALQAKLPPSGSEL